MEITKYFLENVLGKPIAEFGCSVGTGEGENYLSDMFALEVVFQCSGEPCVEHIMCKCFPEGGPARRRLVPTNMFYNELCIYIHFLPDLQQMIENKGLHIQLPFPAFLAGSATNLVQLAEQGVEVSEEHQSYTSNYILMDNVKESLGYKVATKLDSAHVMLVLKELAKLHCLSWAIKHTRNLENLEQEYPFLNFTLGTRWKCEILPKRIPVFAQNVQSDFGEEALTTGTEKLEPIAEQIMEIANEASSGRTEKEFENFLRLRPEIFENEVPWRVAIHGDCWRMNLLFQYDSENNEPKKALFVDLQMMRERCPTLDLVYFIYGTTQEEDRNRYLDSWISGYYEACLEYFQMLKVPPLPDFGLKELKRRFHRSKIFAYFMNAIECPHKTKLANEMYRDGII